MVTSMKPNKTSHILRKLFKELKSPLRVDAEGHLTEKPVFPVIAGGAKAFAKRYMEYNVARKREPASATTIQMRNALEKWSESEWRCQVVNLHGWWVLPIDDERRAMMSKLKQRAMAHISRILSDAWPDYRFNPTSGATTTTARKLSFAVSKVDGTPLSDDNPEPHKCANSARAHLYEMFTEAPAIAKRFHRARWKLHHTFVSDEDVDIDELCDWLCSNVPPATLDYVVKDHNTVRLIVLSNSLTIMVQKTFGDVIRNCLMREGINLNDQTINQEWAEIGSLTNLIDTVDLTSASDSIALHHCSWFPSRWQDYILSTRDTHVRVGSIVHELNMIAGMGNGLIFELESLLFYAMTRAVVDELGLNASHVSVYGDDIIAPRGSYQLLEEFFLATGFLVNKEKSFSEGPFRESCGKHYYNGCDVSPFFVRGDVDDVSDLYHVYNGLSEWQSRTGVDIQEAVAYVGGLIPANLKHAVPDSWGSRSGLQHWIPGLLEPKRVWSRRYQRYSYIYSVVKDGIVDVTGRLPEQMRLTAWLLNAERRTAVCTSTLFVKACSVPTLLSGVVNGLLIDVLEPVANVVAWKGATERSQYRDVSPGGDA